MGIAYISPEMERQLEQAAAALGREAEEVPILALSLLEWFIEKREEGFELLLGRRENPDNHSELQLYAVPPLEVVQMDEQGVAKRGVLDVLAPGCHRDRAS